MEYESPFVVADESKCSRPEDHRWYPGCHANNTGSTLWGKECPKHGPSARTSESRLHEAWCAARERFATMEPGTSEYDQGRLLSYVLERVTETNPPDAPSRIVRSAVPLYANPAYWVGALMVLAAVLFLFV